MSKKLRVAIMGGGGILGQHAPGFTKMADLSEVVAVAESDESQHNRIRKLLKNPKLQIYKNYEELYGLDNIDAVDIILPHSLHMDATIRSAKRGWHVLVEKVMARNIWECQQMIDACEEAGVMLMVCHDRRYAGDWVALKRVIETGVLGKILFWKLEHNQDVLVPEGTWIRSKDMIGGGAIMSCLTHQIDALRWMGGEIREVNSMTLTEPHRMEGECIGIVNAKMDSGSLALLSINWHTQSNDSRKFPLWYEFIHVTGTKGEAYFMQGRDKNNGTFIKLRTPKSHIKEFVKEGTSFVLDKDNNDFVKVKHDQNESGHVKCIEEFVKAARGEDAEVLTYGVDTIKTVEVAEAAYIADTQKKTITLPISGTPWEERHYK
jgi:UDP-N-acetyl-2-amino-2-deoxyglucuronate dehydrogenase